MEGRVKDLLKGCFLLFGVGSGVLWEFIKVHVDRSAAEIKSSQTSHRDVRKGGDLEGKGGWCGVVARHGLCCDSKSQPCFLVEGKIIDR